MTPVVIFMSKTSLDILRNWQVVGMLYIDLSQGLIEQSIGLFHMTTTAAINTDNID